jgi:hypothetical protein
MILSNVLDLRTYNYVNSENQHDLWAIYDVNAIPALERYEMSYARGRCWDILRWLFSSYEIIDKANNELINGFDQVAMQYLAHQASVILEYKKRALKYGINDGVRFSSKDLEKQMKLCFRSYNDIPDITPLSRDMDHTLEFPGAERFQARKLVNPQPYERK